jgi:hypothetical protein
VIHQVPLRLLSGSERAAEIVGDDVIELTHRGGTTAAHRGKALCQRATSERGPLARATRRESGAMGLARLARTVLSEFKSEE